MSSDAAPANASGTPGADTGMVIRARDVGKAYRLYRRPIHRLIEGFTNKPRHTPVHALSGVSFDVRRGECVGVVGSNGAGKTTLLSVLTGTVAPTRGTIDIHGRVSAILGLGVGMLPQYSGRENIEYGLVTRGVPQEAVAKKTQEIIAFSELADFIDNPVHTYSTGMQSRLAFSIAYAVEPEVLIIDEALAVGDAKFVFKCQKKIREFLDAGRTLLFVSHDRTMVEQLCPRALLLDKGRLVADGLTKDVLRQYQLMYFGHAPPTPPLSATEVVDAPPPPKEHGRDDVRMTRLALGGATVSAQGMWETRQGETLHLRATIHTARAIERPAIGVVLANGFAGRVCGFSTVNYGQALPAIDPGEFTFEFRVPLFVPAGTYLCEVTVADLATNPPTLMHTWTEAAQLQVRWSGYSIPGVHDGGAEIELGGTVYSNAAERERRKSLSPAERTIANVAPSGLAAAAMAKVTAPTHSDIVAPVRNAT